MSLIRVICCVGASSVGASTLFAKRLKMLIEMGLQQALIFGRD